MSTLRDPTSEKWEQTRQNDRSSQSNARINVTNLKKITFIKRRVKCKRREQREKTADKRDKYATDETLRDFFFFFFLANNTINIADA